MYNFHCLHIVRLSCRDQLSPATIICYAAYIAYICMDLYPLLSY